MTADVPHPKDLLDLTGRVAIVTGASQGIGAGIAKRFATAGARVVVHYRRDRQSAKHVAAAIVSAGGTAVAITAKLDTEEGVARFFAESDDRLGPADILINNAGQNFPLHPLAEISLAEWQAMFRDNLESMFLCTQAAAAVMRERGGGAIVNIGSISALNPAIDHSHYNSAKAAVLA
nr:SDR family NAD(P)-dependent oxidoreductase [Gemmatimonadales bacterium]